MRLLDGPESWWLHEFRKGPGLAEWKKPGTRRRDMRGMAPSHHQNRKTTSVSFSAVACGHKKRQFDCHKAHSLKCLFCGEEHEDEDHMLWRCPQWETLRREKQAGGDGREITVAVRRDPGIGRALIRDLPSNLLLHVHLT